MCKLKLYARLIKAATGVMGGALILTENHPYLALIILALGAVANECIDYLRDNEAK